MVHGSSQSPDTHISERGDGGLGGFMLVLN